MPSDDRFADAVKPALEALLSDLQHTTEVLRRAHISDRQSEARDEADLSNNRLEQSSRKSLGPPSQAQSYNDVRFSGRSPSRDILNNDSMIGTMNSELSSKHGVNTIPKGDCAHCGKPIIGQVVIALGKMWHPEHYVCCECGAELGHRPFFERNGRAFCEEDYHNQFSPKCSGCHGAIKDRCVTALNKNYHFECFVCSECGKEFGEDGFHEKNGQTYCKRDFFRLFAPKCNGCTQPITSNFITALGTHWHPDCFVCQGNDHFAAKCPMDVTYFEEEGIY